MSTLTHTQEALLGLDWNAELPSGEPALGGDVTLTAQLVLVKGQA